MSRYALNSRVELNNTPLRARYNDENNSHLQAMPQVPKVGVHTVFNKKLLEQLNTDLEKLQITRIKQLGEQLNNRHNFLLNQTLHLNPNSRILPLVNSPSYIGPPNLLPLMQQERKLYQSKFHLHSPELVII